MAKKKDAGGKADKPRSKSAIPKQIAGVKIPKTLRDSGKAAMKLAQNPVARELLSAGLIAAATAVTANSRARKAALDGGRDAADAVSGAAATASDNAAKLGAALVDAAGNAAQRFLNGDKAAKTKSATARKAKPASKAKASGTRTAKPAKSAEAKKPAKPRGKKSVSPVSPSGQG